MSDTTLIFPHQLFQDNPAIFPGRTVYLIEEFLFFRQFKFHKKKITFHRASMKFYQNFLHSKNIKVEYIDAHDERADIRLFIPYLKNRGIDALHVVNPTDDWLIKRIKQTAQANEMKVVEYESPMFLNSVSSLQSFFDQEGPLRQTTFYIQQRKSRNILINDSQPSGGKWTFDSENRRKYPKDRAAPKVTFPPLNLFYQEALTYTEKYFGNNPGECDASFNYPCTFKESREWLQKFLQHRFADFGAYEDAIVDHDHFLHHAVLTPMLNAGLLTPNLILQQVLEHAEKHSIPLNSLEGFIRQLVGWREFIRGVYLFKGGRQRSTNYWTFSNSIPHEFYTGSTGILPLDQTIKKVLKTGYCHHIERLMILGNFMLLCEINPNEVYRWFMELFIDAFDWVMVPNVYGMSQFSDGGLMATKPYISGSNYLLKMSNYPKGDWQKVWDGLFWRFMNRHRDFFLQNPRLGMLVHTFDKMPAEKQSLHISTADAFLQRLYSYQS